VFNPFGDGSFTPTSTLDAIRDEAFLTNRVKTRTISVMAEGVPRSYFNNPLRVSLGVDFSKYSLKSGTDIGSLLRTYRRGRDLKSAYAELVLPLHRTINLSMAGRLEDYKGLDTYATHRLGLQWKPARWLGLRSTFVKSIRPPDLIDLDETLSGAGITMMPDPSGLNGVSTVLVRFGSNPDLQPAYSGARTFGMDIQLPEQKFWGSLTYFNITSSGRVERIEDSAPIMESAAYAAIVDRNPTPEERLDACSQATLMGTLDDCLNVPIAAIVDTRLHNVATLKTSGIDIFAIYERMFGRGRLTSSINRTHLFNYQKAEFSSSPLTEIVSTQTNPIDRRWRTSLSWTYGPFGVSGSFNYVDDYRDVEGDPSQPRRVPSWLTLDLGASYGATLEEPDRLSGFTVTLNAKNAFDKAPPFLNNRAGIAYDPENADVLGRVVSIHIRKKW
jgi:iron complex outermembrane receptor protein